MDINDLIVDDEWSELAARLRYLCDSGEIWEVDQIMGVLSNRERLEFYTAIRHDSWLRNSIKACQHYARGGNIGVHELTAGELAEMWRAMAADDGGLDVINSADAQEQEET